MRHTLSRTLFIIVLSTFLTSADVLLDDFMNYFGGTNSQCHIGEAYGYSITMSNNVDTGGGQWRIYHDELGTEVTDWQQMVLNDSNLDQIVENDILHIFFKTHLSSADFYTSWPFAGIWCGIMAGDSAYWDFSNMTAISMQIKC